MDYGSKYKLLTAAGHLSRLWSSPILTSDLQVGAAGLTDIQCKHNTMKYCTGTVCEQYFFLESCYCTIVEIFVCVMYNGEGVT